MLQAKNPCNKMRLVTYSFTRIFGKGSFLLLLLLSLVIFDIKLASVWPKQVQNHIVLGSVHTYSNLTAWMWEYESTQTRSSGRKKESLSLFYRWDIGAQRLLTDMKKEPPKTELYFKRGILLY